MSVLIVDDEHEILNTLKRHCQIHDISCQTASSAQDALKLIKEQLFPVVLTDIRMPEMNGIVLMKEIKKINPTCIVFFMTGFSSMEYLLDCLEYGAADYFTKPIEDIEFVMNSLRAAIERSNRWKKDMLQVNKSKSGV